MRFTKRYRKPRLDGIRRTFQMGLDRGGTIILAHAGLPYFASDWWGSFFEHSDFEAVRAFLERNGTDRPGRIYADVSATCTPSRSRYFDVIPWILSSGGTRHMKSTMSLSRKGTLVSTEAAMLSLSQ